MDEKLQKQMKTVMALLAFPAAALALYGLYFVFTYHAKPKPPEPKIVTFRAEGKLKGAAADSKDGKKKAVATKKSDEPQVWDVELVWEVENAEEITVDQGIGKVDAKGSRHVEIDKNTTYIMKAKNIAGEVTYNLDVEVVPVAQ